MNYPPATTLDSLFDQFLNERTYLKNVTPCTLVWYRTAFKNYRAALERSASMWPTKAALQQFAISMRERGVRPVTCNTNIGAMNAFCLWLHQEGHATEHVKLAKMRVEHGLQGFHGALLLVPKRDSDRPGRRLLEERYAAFRRAS